MSRRQICSPVYVCKTFVCEVVISCGVTTALGFITTGRATTASWRGGTRSSCPGSSCTTAPPSRGLPAPRSTSLVSWSKTGFFYKTCVKVADLSGGRKIKNQMQLLWSSEFLEWQQRSLNMLNMHILKAKDPQSQRRSLKENKRVASHTLFASAHYFSMKNVQEDSSSSKASRDSCL